MRLLSSQSELCAFQESLNRRLQTLDLGPKTENDLDPQLCHNPTSRIVLETCGSVYQLITRLHHLNLSRGRHVSQHEILPKLNQLMHRLAIKFNPDLEADQSALGLCEQLDLQLSLSGASQDDVAKLLSAVSGLSL